MKYTFQKLTGVPYHPYKDRSYYWYNPDTLTVHFYASAKDAWYGAVSEHKSELSACTPVHSVVLVLGPDNAYLFPGAKSPCYLSGKEFGLSKKAQDIMEARFDNAKYLYDYIFNSPTAKATNWKKLQDVDEVTLIQLFYYATRYSGYYTSNFWDRLDEILGK